MTMLLDRSRVEIKLAAYGTAPATALSDPGLLPKVQEYRRISGSRMIPLDREGMKQKIPAADHHVSRKVDGEFTVLILRGGLAFTLNPGGTVRVGLPFLDEAASLLSKAGVNDVLIAGELYVHKGSGRTRVHDVSTTARGPKSEDDLRQLRFAVFDIISEGNKNVVQPFTETWKTITKWFGKGERIHPVEAKTAKDASEIGRIFEEWVEKEGAEGLVVRSDTAGIFKIKPRHSIDVAVLGFTESQADRQGMLHDLLMGVQRDDGTLQVLGRVGGGFTEDQRRDMLSDLKDMVVESEYAEVNSDHVAYQMVQPDWVAEVSCLDLISQTTRGGSVDRMVLDFKNNGSKEYRVVTKLPLATVISPQFVRRRDDKKVRPQDVGMRQVTGIVEVPLSDRDARQLTLPLSEILRREVYTKDLKGQTMVRKFVMWKTNKEATDEFPAYVMHFTDFSPNRKDPLSREVRVSSSQTQIEQLLTSLKEENLKAGWLPRDAAGATATAITPPTTAIADASGEVSASAPKEPAKKKKAKAADVPPAEATPDAAAEGGAVPVEPVKKGRKKKG
jgi:ATP dependent DNA ligase-like protein